MPVTKSRRWYAYHACRAGVHSQGEILMKVCKKISADKGGRYATSGPATASRRGGGGGAAGFDYVIMTQS